MVMNPMFRKATQNRVFQDVVHQVQEAILDGTLKAGERLPSERDLVEMFKTSRGTLREALRVLEQKGLIEIKLGTSGGAMVKAVNNEQMSESLALLLRAQKVSLDHLAEFREGVEGHVTALAAERASEQDIHHLKELLAEAHRFCELGTSHRNEFIRADEKLHMTLALLTGNTIYMFVLQTVHENIHQYYDRYLAMSDEEIKENYQDLSDIVRAVEERRPTDARAIAEGHVRRFNHYMKSREASLDQSRN